MMIQKMGKEVKTRDDLISKLETRFSPSREGKPSYDREHTIVEVTNFSFTHDSLGKVKTNVSKGLEQKSSWFGLEKCSLRKQRENAALLQTHNPRRHFFLACNVTLSFITVL
jgi:hypothetical protein